MYQDALYGGNPTGPSWIHSYRTQLLGVVFDMNWFKSIKVIVITTTFVDFEQPRKDLRDWQLRIEILGTTIEPNWFNQCVSCFLSPSFIGMELSHLRANSESQRNDTYFESQGQPSWERKVFVSLGAKKASEWEKSIRLVNLITEGLFASLYETGRCAFRASMKTIWRYANNFSFVAIWSFFTSLLKR